jgi:hypothetical protein
MLPSTSFLASSILRRLARGFISRRRAATPLCVNPGAEAAAGIVGAAEAAARTFGAASGTHDGAVGLRVGCNCHPWPLPATCGPWLFMATCSERIARLRSVQPDVDAAPDGFAV